MVQDASVDAEKSAEIVTRATEAMCNIERSSTEVGRIIGVIDEIATAASVTLTSEAEEMGELVAQFKTEAESGDSRTTGWSHKGLRLVSR